MEHLIDSNVLIDYVAERFTNNQLEKLDEIFDATFSISIITKIETLGFNAKSEEIDKLKLFLNAASIIPLNDDVVQQTIDLKSRLR